MWLFVAAFATVACTPAEGRGPSRPPKGERAWLAAPPWLPDYTPAQKALLAPVSAPVQIPAARVFPDLERFGYSPNKKLEDPVDAMKFTKLVATVLHDSPRFYSLGAAPPELANTIAQYGPAGAPEPDGFAVVVREDSGIGRIVRAEPSSEARASFERGAAAGKSRDAAGAIEAFRAAAVASPKVPGLHVALGEALASAGDRTGARRAFDAALAVDPTLASAHQALAELHFANGAITDARHSIAEALAYHPGSKRILDAADRITNSVASSGRGRVRPLPIFIDVDAVGAVHVASVEDDPTLMYASCRAVMRYEPDLRAAIFSQPRETPYYLSQAEEVICLEAAIGAWLWKRANPEDGDDDGPGAAPPGASDDAMAALLRLAQRDGLGGYVMFEILGKHRPERARAAPDDVHKATVRYVETVVLAGGDAPPPDGTYTAAL